MRLAPLRSKARAEPRLVRTEGPGSQGPGGCSAGSRGGGGGWAGGKFMQSGTVGRAGVLVFVNTRILCMSVSLSPIWTRLPHPFLIADNSVGVSGGEF